jgi:AcrR family transcriptional regulator
MPKLVNATDQRHAIRQAARRVFARRGVRGTGLTHVAEAAGMGRSSLYHYYPDKESLLSDMLREMLAAERQLFRVCLRSEARPIERLERLARACATLFPEWAAFGRLILDLRLEETSQLRGYFRDLRREVAGVIADGQADGSITRHREADVLASVLIGAIDGLLLQYFIDPKALPEAEVLAETLADLTQRMVAA